MWMGLLAYVEQRMSHGARDGEHVEEGAVRIWRHYEWGLLQSMTRRGLLAKEKAFEADVVDMVGSGGRGVVGCKR